MNGGTHTWREIVSQPTVWRRTMERFEAGRESVTDFLRQSAMDRIVLVGCGSTHYLADAAARTLSHCTGIPAQALPSSEMWLFPDRVPSERTLLLAISRSGTTTETLRALEWFQGANGGSTLAITCDPESPLALRSDVVLTAPDAQEQSVAQTRSFASMFILAQALTAAMAENEEMLSNLHRLPDALQDLEGRLDGLPKRLGEDHGIEKLFFLGGGPYYGLASEAMLKVKEMSLSTCEAYHPLEIRHGPMSMVDEATLVVGLLSDSGWAQEVQVLEDMSALGARTLALTEDEAAFTGWRPDDVIEVDSGLDEWERGVLYLPPLQRLAFHRAVANGLDPDRPTHLKAVIEI